MSAGAPPLDPQRGDRDFNRVLDESIPLSPALASAVQVQQIGEIAADNVRRERGELSAADEAMIASFEAGLREGRLVVRGPLASPVVGHLLVFLTELADESTLRVFYEEADEWVGGPVWSWLSEPERATLLREGLGLATAVRAIYEKLPLFQPVEGEAAAPTPRRRGRPFLPADQLRTGRLQRRVLPEIEALAKQLSTEAIEAAIREAARGAGIT